MSVDVLLNRDLKINVLDAGYVELIDVLPRLITPGRSIEDTIVTAARVSYRKDLADVRSDAILVDYLMRNRHTSPLEHISFTYRIRLPKFAAIHLLRHRTAKVNEESQRYCEVQDDYYHPTRDPEYSVRQQCQTNKQTSETITDGNKRENIMRLLGETEDLIDKIFSNYHDLIELGLAREEARFCLPMATYTTMIYTMDLHNLMHFITLRDDSKAQTEVRTIARAMWKLVSPLMPTVSRVFDDIRGGMYLSLSEVEAVRNGVPLDTKSKSRLKDYNEKVGRLNISSVSHARPS